MPRSEVANWLRIATDAAALGFESAEVIGLRLAGAVAGRPGAAAEAWRMGAEKVLAMAELQALFLTGSLGASPYGAANGAVKYYRRKVAANRGRLRKGSR